MTTNLQHGKHIFNRNTLHLHPTQQAIYTEIQAQKEKCVNREHVPVDEEPIRSKPTCGLTPEIRILTSNLSQTQEFGRDPFTEIVEALCEETRPQDGWVSRMIIGHQKSLKERHPIKKGKNNERINNRNTSTTDSHRGTCQERNNGHNET